MLPLVSLSNARVDVATVSKTSSYFHGKTIEIVKFEHMLKHDITVPKRS